MKKKAMFYCQHVLGMGHLIRSAEIVRGLANNGFKVSFLNGGEIVEGFKLFADIELVNLPPIKSDAEFRELQVADSELTLEEIKTERCRRILAEYERLQPDVLIIELFPFGRRKFAFELIPLLNRIRDDKRTKVVCSLRDILVSKRDQTRFEDQVCNWMNKYFDLLLVHSDPQFQRLEETFPRASQIQCPIRYTGFVVQQPEDIELIRDNTGLTILVSIGGGRVGCELLEASIAASELIANEHPHRLQIFTGPYLPAEDFNRLRQLAGEKPNIRIERFTPNFLDHLQHADLSISMAGYNTCMNLLTTGTPALVLPFAGNNNEEQTIRANKLERLETVTVLRDGDLTPAVLAEKILAVGRQARTGKPTLDLSGATTTAEIVWQLFCPIQSKRS
jgi:predicted glycosyltransferase